MATIDVSVLSGGDRAGADSLRAELEQSVPPNTITVSTVDGLDQVVPPTNEIAVVLEPGARVVREWYLPLVAGADWERDRAHPVPLAWSSTGAGAAAHRDLCTGPGWRAALAGELDRQHRRVAPATVTTGPKVSVFLPTFNRLRMLARSLECLAAQTYRELEVVVVNDGGLDVSAVVGPFAGRLDVRLVTQDRNYGRSYAYNRAIAEASGRWMMGLADDDTIQPDHVSTLVSHAIGHPGNVLTYAPTWLVTEDQFGNELGRQILHDGEHHRSFILVENFVFAETSLFERQLALDLGGFDHSLEVLEDWEFWIRLAQHSDLVYVPTPTSEYRVRATFADNSFATRGPARFFQTQQEIYERYPVPAGSWVERIRRIRLDGLRPTQEGQHAYDHTIGVVGNGDVEALVRCISSIAQLSQRQSVQLVVHELRSPAIEQVLGQLEGQIICLAEHYDPEHAIARISQQAGGRQLTIIASNEVVG